MKSVILNGIEVKVGSLVRFINDTEMYVGINLNKPILYGYYIVRGFSNGGFLLEGVKNEEQNIFTKEDESEFEVAEPGFAFDRFIAVVKYKKEYKINFKISREVVESLDMKSISKN